MISRLVAFVQNRAAAFSCVPPPGANLFGRSPYPSRAILRESRNEEIARMTDRRAATDLIEAAALPVHEAS
jgi:hypothetical protein